MLRKVKLLLVTVAAMIFVMVPSMFAFAAEVSEKAIEVPQDGKRHTVCAFGDCITMIHSDGRMEIITNDPSGRIDVMIDGQVTKGVGHMVVPAANKTNLVLEEGSFIVSGVTEAQVSTIKKMAADGLTADAPIASLAVIAEQTAMEGVATFTLGKDGALQNADGTSAPVNALPQTEVKNAQKVYEDFAQEMQETIRRETQEAVEREAQEATPVVETVEKKEETSNGISGQCNHTWEAFNDRLTIYNYQGSDVACAINDIVYCKKCNSYMWSNTTTIVKHEKGAKTCSLCVGWSATGACEHEKVPYSGFVRLTNYEGSPACASGNLVECTTCNKVDITNATITMHTTDDYCNICQWPSWK